jgi:hypothetical protein
VDGGGEQRHVDSTGRMQSARSDALGRILARLDDLMLI